MRLKTLLIVLTALSLTSCDDAPKEPDIKVCTPIIAYLTPTEIDWNQSFIFCVLRKEPNNETHFERIPIFEFLTEKPRLIKADDYNKVAIWEQELKTWAKENCQPKKQ